MLSSINPATGAVVGSVPITDVAAIPAIIARAHAAQRHWGALSLEDRARHLRAAQQRLDARATEMGTLISHELGKPIKEALGEARHAGASLSEAVEESALALAPELMVDESVSSTLLYDPLGVAACITPWNFPVLMPQDVVIPSLMAGNAVILKPSEKTPLSGQAWAECFMASLPPDVLQVVHGDEQQGKALVAGDVQLIAFVGSRAAGTHILREAAGSLKRVVLELGGKDALIVLDDADIDAAVAFAARNCFRNAGQVCVSTERIYVHQRVADTFEERLAARAQEIRQGDPSLESTEVGPMVDAQQSAHVSALVDEAIALGARRLAGTGAASGDNYFRPTVLADVTHAMRIMREETFGPVACIMRVDSDTEAVRLANDSPYGLGGSVFGSVEHAESVARRLNTAMVGINKGCGGASGTPWVGARQSGYGYHSGKAGNRQFAQVRVISRAR
ncbi:MAG: aldehyde dehydrogenase [Phycisphaerales bacterium]|nr:aldehyde dehydrogenase [Phycisphaerales bacterium]